MRRRRWSELEDGSRRALLARANTGVPHPWFRDGATVDGHGPIFDHGAGVWGAFDDAACLAVAGVVTRNLPTTGEVFVTGLVGEPDGLRWLVRVAMSEAQASGATTVRAGAGPDDRVAEEVLREAGFDEVDRLWDLAARAPVASGSLLDLRPAREEDLPRYVALFNRSFAGTPNAAVIDAGDARAALDRPGGAGFAVHEGVEVGVFELAVDGDAGVIEGLALAPEHRGRGLGRPLLAACVHRLRALPGVGPEVRLTVMEHHHPAIDLYLRSGFVRVGVRSRWFARVLVRR